MEERKISKEKKEKRTKRDKPHKSHKHSDKNRSSGGHGHLGHHGVYPKNLDKVIQDVKAQLVSLGDINPEVTAALRTVSIYIGNTVRFPDEAKYFQINLTNKGYQDRVEGFPPVVKILSIVGFTKRDDGFLRLEMPKTQEHFEALESLVAAVLTELDSYSSSKPVPAPQISQPSLPQYPTPHPPQDRPASSQYSMPSHSPFQSPSLSQNPFAGPGASPFECATSPLPTSEHLSPLLLDEGSERLTDSTLQTSSDSQNSAVKRIQTSDPNFNPQQIEELCNNAWNGGDIQDFQVLLSDMSIDAINSTNSRGQTALYCACRQGRQAHVETLLQIRGIDINKGETVKQGTPLHAAGWESHVGICAMLIWMGADINKLNSYNLTPIEEARGEAGMIYVIQSKQGLQGIAKKFPQVLSLNSEYAESFKRLRVRRSEGPLKTIEEIQCAPSIVPLDRASSVTTVSNTSSKVTMLNPYTEEILDFYTGHL